MYVTIALLFFFVGHATSIEVPDGYKYKECNPDAKKCEYWLIVRETLTMIKGKKLVKPFNGSLYFYHDDPAAGDASKVDIKDVVTVDGVNRMAITVNGTIPGPPIVVYEHQELVIHVRNLLLSDAVSIHWHGMHQRNTPFMDGVGWISQCPIASGQTFTYQFKAEPKGTFWYHSHVGAQRSNGVFGALIVKEKPKKNMPPSPTDVIMQIGDWHHSSSEEVYIKMIYGNFIRNEPYSPTRTLDGGRFSGVPWDSALIEGKGRYYEEGVPNGSPLTWYKVKKGHSYRFRVINVGTIYPLRVSVDGHNISVLASDGYDVKPQKMDEVVVNPGERFDFLLKANAAVGNYWVRVESMEINVRNHTVEAVLHYEGASMNEPISTKRKCTDTEPCIIVNCPFKYFPERMNVNCILVADLENLDDEDPAPEYTKNSQEHFLNFAFPGEGATPGSVNGRKFEFPGVNSLTQGDELGDFNCSKHECGHDKICYCHYELEIPFGETIQMVWTNLGNGAGWGHPIHMHGHSFYVLKMDYAKQNMTTGKLLNANYNSDIDCGGDKNFCNAAQWKDSSWENGNVVGLNLKNPPRKDTLIIPTGGYAVLRIRSDNPGKWFMHCHIEVHALDGMAMVLSEQPDKAPKPPKGFPVCQNFYNDQTRDIQYHKNPTEDDDDDDAVDEDDADDKDDDDNVPVGLYVAIGVLAFIALVFLASTIYFSRKSK